MFPNEMDFYHFLSPRDSFIGQASGRSGTIGDPLEKCSSALRLLKNTVVGKGDLQEFPLMLKWPVS